jgi:3-oxoadipate enol-lactonase
LSPYYRAAAWDARGYGASDDYSHELSFEDFCHDLARLLDYFETDQAHLCGLSMGGQIVQHFYRLYPQRVASMVLAATFTHWRAVLSDEALAHYLSLRETPLVTEGKSPAEMAPAAAKTILGPLATPRQREIVEKSMAALHKESFLKTLRAATAFEPELALESVTIPTMLIFSEFDNLCPADYGRSMASRIPRSRFEYVEGAGHLINIEKSKQFDTLLLDFLSGLDSETE